MPEIFWVAGNQPHKAIISEVRELLLTHPRAKVVNMCHHLKNITEFAHTFHRDIFSQQLEQYFWKPAYNAALLTLDHCETNHLMRCTFHGLHHDIAYRFMYYFFYRSVLKKFRNQNIIFIIPIDKQTYGYFSWLWNTPDEDLHSKFRHTDRQDTYASHIIPMLARLCDERTIMVCYDDSGSGINSTVAEALIFKIRERGFKALILSLWGMSSPCPDDEGVICPITLAPSLSSEALAVAMASTMRIIRQSLHSAAQRGLIPPAPWLAPLGCRLESASQFLGIVALTCISRIYEYIDRMQQLVLAAHTASSLGITSAACVNESLAVCAAMSSISEEIGIRCVGVPTVLLMDHPTCRYFPSAQHLAYGSQHVELMIRAGVRENDIHQVGSFYFDRTATRNSEADRQYTQGLLPGWRGQPLVIIATEHRPRQFLELGPTLTALAKRDDLFVVIKLHPDDRQDIVADVLERAGSPDHLVVVDKCDVLALLNTSDLLVTLGSNLIIEGAAMGKLSLCYNYSGDPCPIDFVKEGLCLGATTPDMCLERIDLLISDTKLRRKAIAMLENIKRYNAFNDGRSLERTLDFITPPI